jgi:hypothetical protein
MMGGFGMSVGGHEFSLLALTFVLLWAGAFSYMFVRAYVEAWRRQKARRAGLDPDRTPPNGNADPTVGPVTASPPRGRWGTVKHTGHQIFRCLITYRVPIIGAILILMPWLQSAQIRESYRAELIACSELRDSVRYMEFHAALLAVFLNVSLYMAGSARLLMSRLAPDRWLESRLIVFAPVVYIITTIILFSVVVLSGEFREYHRELLANGLPLVRHALRYPSHALLLYLFIAIVALITWGNLLTAWRYDGQGKLALPSPTRLQRAASLILGLGFVIWALLIRALSGDPSPFEHWLTRILLNFGAPQTSPVTEIFYSLSLWMAGLFFLSARFRVPALELAVLVALVWSYFDWNDNHRIRMEATKESPRDVRGVFEKWVMERPDLHAYAGRTHYPVYVVAAEGGGIYSAVHTAIVLSRLQDKEPAFADHLFAISSVSGGSLGAAVFTSLAKASKDCTIGSCDARVSLERRAIEVLSTDFLTPLLNRALRADLLQRILPFPVEAFDRARSLEEAFADAWKGYPSPMRAGVLQEASAGKGPFVLLNATEAETGHRVVISPLSMKGSSELAARPSLKGLFDIIPAKDIALSTAVGLSARFPLITPAGWYPVYDGERMVKRRFVDGGYFDNSGIETALDLIGVLELAKKTLVKTPGLPEIRIILISISSQDVGQVDAGSHGFGETLTPYRAMINSWRARTALTVANAAEILDPRFVISVGPSRMRELVLFADESGLPLGWHLSPVTINKIATWAAGAHCVAGVDAVGDGATLADKRNRSHCALQTIVDELKPSSRVN